MRVRQMIHAGHQVGRERLAVRRDAAHRDAAETHAVIAALAADEAGALPFTARAVVRQRDLECGIHRLRTGVDEEDAVQPRGHDLGHLLRRAEGHGVAHLEGRREVHGGGLRRDGVDDRLAAMAGVDAPQARRAVQHLAAVGVAVVHALRGDQQARRGLVLAVGREGHPEVGQIGGFQRVRGGFHRQLQAKGTGPDRAFRQTVQSGMHIGHAQIARFAETV